jgi:mycothiol synthase
MKVLVQSELSAAQLADLSALLDRSARADAHPALAEPQRAAAGRQDLGAEGAKVVLAYQAGSLVGCAVITPAIDGATALHVAVDPAQRTGSIRMVLVQSALSHVHGRVRLWLMQATDADDAEAAQLGFRPERDVLQMRVPLPLPAETAASARPVVTRPFRPGHDDDAWLTINNQAFADHPEQGGWTVEDLRARTHAAWFDPEGFLVADNADNLDTVDAVDAVDAVDTDRLGSGHPHGLLGSCWTKVHREGDPVLGEIYVISVDPARHSEGWGRALTVAGLQWMSANRSTPVGMLYTTASNTAAVALYESLGFTIDHVDRSYLNTIS